MKLFTLRLFQFAFCALLVTILFRYILNICIVQNGWILPVLCSIVYFGSMFLCGLYFGRKDEIENGIHDIGFRFHITTYIMCIGMSFLSFYIGWETETLKSIEINSHYSLVLGWHPLSAFYTIPFGTKENYQGIFKR